MTTQEAQNLILAGFAAMNKEQRKTMLKFLKLAKPKLDFNFPNGAPVDEQKPEPKPSDGLILPTGPIIQRPA